MVCLRRCTGDGSVSGVDENQNVIKTTVFGDIEPSPVSVKEINMIEFSGEMSEKCVRYMLKEESKV